jgi:hypothetical protein
MADQSMSQSGVVFKVCRACSREKPIEEFGREPKVRSGRSARCKSCVGKSQAAWAAAHPDRVKLSREKYAAKYPERVQEAQNFEDRRAALERREKRVANGRPILGPRQTEEGRRCSRCEERKPIGEFPPNSGHYDGLSCYCRPCVNSIGRAEGKKPHIKTYRRKYMRKYGLKKYGLTIDEFEKTVVIQNGKCAICGDELRLGTGGCSVDHRHSDGKIRGLLCRLCNVGIGHFRENTEIMASAMEYLRQE